MIENKEKTIECKRETRMKILIGSYFLEKYRADDKFDDIIKMMDGYLVRESDRKIFGLKPLLENTKNDDVKNEKSDTKITQIDKTNSHDIKS